MPRPSRLLAALLACAALGLAACGEDEETTPAEATTGATGATLDMTAGDFLVELQPEKQRILEEVVADTPACRGVEVDDGFVLLLSAQASEADPGEPLAELVEREC